MHVFVNSTERPLETRGLRGCAADRTAELHQSVQNFATSIITLVRSHWVET
jgi:hypothetical protein